MFLAQRLISNRRGRDCDHLLLCQQVKHSGGVLENLEV